MQIVATGKSAFTTNQIATGPTQWLDSPVEVLSFIETEPKPSPKIVIVRGGATTFLSLVVDHGVAGIITLQGSPESHLGIIAREYGTPCILSARFTHGSPTLRGETVPPDGTQLQIDVSGNIGIISSTDIDTLTPAAHTGTDDRRLGIYLNKFRALVEAGAEGSRIVEASLSTDILRSFGDSDRDLKPAEMNDLLEYAAWNEWDILASRATEGESALIPRPQYEVIGFLNCWMEHPSWLSRVSGLVNDAWLQARISDGRDELGNKFNSLHIWALLTSMLFGRSAAEQAQIQSERSDRKISTAMAFVRKLYGMYYGGQPIFASLRDFTNLTLGERAIAEITREGEAAKHEGVDAFRSLTAAAELLSFLVHFDSRLGVADSGPYPLGDGGRLVVREIFFSEENYSWGQASDSLPYALIIGMTFPDSEVELSISDLGTLFSEPNDYFEHLTHFSVRVRKSVDSAATEYVHPRDFNRLILAIRARMNQVYRDIANMSELEKIQNGAIVYSAGFMLPLLRVADLEAQFLADGLMEVRIEPERLIGRITHSYAAAEEARVFIEGDWGSLFQGEEIDPNEFRLLHCLAIKGVTSVEDLLMYSGLAASDLVEAEGADLVRRAFGPRGGYILSTAGEMRHSRLLTLERTLESRPFHLFEEFGAINSSMKSLMAAHQLQPDETNTVIAAVSSVIDQLHVLFSTYLSSQDRFVEYEQRLREALKEYAAGDSNRLVEPLSNSIHDIWMELHEDLIRSFGQVRGSSDE